MLLIHANIRRERGFTLVELMISMTISLVIILALAGIFANNSRARNEIDRASQQTENGRYALQLMADDLRNAGYDAELNTSTLTTPATKPNACATDVATLNAAMMVAVQGYDNGAGAPACIADLRAGTDILVVRRASTCAVGDAGCDAQVAGDPYLQASTCSSTTELSSGNPLSYYVLDTNAANLTMHLKDCVTVAPIHQYRTHIYFIANDDKPNDGIPTLKRAELGAGAFTTVPLVEGIENLQIEYGIDTAAPTTGSPAVYTANPDLYLACPPATCIGYWRNVVSVKLNVLSRNITTTPGYADSKTYTLGLNFAGAANTFGPFNDGYRRHVYDMVVRLNNVAGRNSP